MIHLLTSGHNAKCGAAWSRGSTGVEEVTCRKCLRLAAPRQIESANARLRRKMEKLQQAMERIARFCRQ